MQINPCSCGTTPEFIKLFPSKRYDGFLRCPTCGHEARTYASKQCAVISWNKSHPTSPPTPAKEDNSPTQEQPHTNPYKL